MKKTLKNKISAKSSITLFFDSKDRALAAYKALLAETDFSHRGYSEVSFSGKKVIINIFAEDLVSLRASINSYLRLAYVIKSIDEEK
jgi:tRNA threonylcarbamoyladenosine modification (KEOPS) complex  Pcc1 subunit